MAYEDMESGEKAPKTTAPTVKNLSLQEAINLGEYDPEYLASFPEWHTLSRNIQFEYIRKGLDNRSRQLVQRWAELQNMLDYRLKPHLKEAQENIKKQMEVVDRDREKLYLEYSK